VMRSNHWRMSLRSTALPQRSQQPCVTSSLASPVLHDGHQLMGTVALVGQALLEKLQEDPLRPLDVFGIGGVDLAIPVVGKADGVDLAAEVGYGPSRWSRAMDAGLDGVVLGRQTKGVPSHGCRTFQPCMRSSV